MNIAGKRCQIFDDARRGIGKRLLFYGLIAWTVAGLPACRPPVDYQNVRVSYVYDGDTVQLENGEKLRLIGIDSPEAYPSDKLRRDARRSGLSDELIMRQGKKASAFTRDLVSGKMVRLEFDIERRDKYGRLLGYVYLDEDTMLNAVIIQAGYARPMPIPPNVRYADEFDRLYQEARSAGSGLWQSPSLAEAVFY
ncbi:MAG: thermonuclease family protein [Candidatus Omnitrophota bacterium]